LVGAKNTFSSTLNVMILQMVRNESVRFGRHIDIEASYKILQLEVPKLVLILYYLACFQKGLFGGNFEHIHPSSLRSQEKQHFSSCKVPKQQTTSFWFEGILGINTPL
jgi:hypothetical protein